MAGEPEVNTRNIILLIWNCVKAYLICFNTLVIVIMRLEKGGGRMNIKPCMLDRLWRCSSFSDLISNKCN